MGVNRGRCGSLCPRGEPWALIGVGVGLCAPEESRGR